MAIIPPSGPPLLPASVAVPPSTIGSGGRHTLRMHEVPAQQFASLWHVAPDDAQLTPWQRSTPPSAPGRHSWPLQH